MSRALERVRWWESLVVIAVCMYAAMRVTAGQPGVTWREYLAYGAAAAVAWGLLVLLSWWKRRRADSEISGKASRTSPS